VQLVCENGSFADATGVFEISAQLTVKQEIVGNEERFASVGADFLGRVVVVIYTYRRDDIRLISAGPATITERNAYERRRV